MATADVRDRLVAAAEELLARQGLDAVSLREINVAAGTANASAVQYHFGGRAGLLRAVLDKHRPAIEARRHALLDRYEGADLDDLRELVAAYVRPLASELDTPGGPGYLQLLADVVNRPRVVIDANMLEDPADSTARWRALVAPLLPPEAVRLHRRFLATRFTFSELARRARDRPHEDSSRFVSDLIDLTTALLAAPVSAETARKAPAASKRRGR